VDNAGRSITKINRKYRDDRNPSSRVAGVAANRAPEAVAGRVVLVAVDFDGDAHIVEPGVCDCDESSLARDKWGVVDHVWDSRSGQKLSEITFGC